MQTTQQFIDGCLAYYAANDIRPLDPNEGVWHRAHHPVPHHAGGTETVWLLKEHHAIHGVLQSEEVGHPSLFGWEKQELLHGHFVTDWFELNDLFAVWRSRLARIAANCLHASKTKGGKSAHAIKAALTRHHG